MKKSEVYSWRTNTEIKTALEEAARNQHTSVAQLLDHIVRTWLDRASSNEDDEVLQRRLHEAAEKTLGSIRGGDPLRSEQVNVRIKEKLKTRHARPRTD